MSALTKAVHDYLALRRSLGFKLHDVGVALLDFAPFMEQRHARCITTELALAWAEQPSNALPAHCAQRLSHVCAQGIAKTGRPSAGTVREDPGQQLPIATDWYGLG